MAIIPVTPAIWSNSKSSIRSSMAAGNNTFNFAAGTYTLTSSTSFILGSNTKLIGVDGAKIVGGTFGPMISASSKSGITIQNLEITHNAPSGNYGTDPWTAYYTMHFSDVDTLTISNCYIHDGYGDFIICRSCENIFVHDNRMYYSGHECLYALTCANVQFFNNRCRNRENSACRLSGTSTNGASIHHNDIDGHKYGSSDSCTGPGIQIDTTAVGGEVKNIRIYNNNIHNIVGAGIWLQSDNTPSLSHNVYIYDNTFTSCGSGTATHQRAAINGFQIHNVYIERNTFTSNTCALRLVYRYLSGAAQPSSKYTWYFRHNVGQQSIIKENSALSKSGGTYNISNHTVITTGTDVTTPDGGTTPTPITHDPTVTITRDNNNIESGGLSTLTWTAQYCTSATVQNVPNMSSLPLGSSATLSTGTIPVHPTSTTTYYIYGTNGSTTVNAWCKVDVKAVVIPDPFYTSYYIDKTPSYVHDLVVIYVKGLGYTASAVLRVKTTSTTYVDVPIDPVTQGTTFSYPIVYSTPGVYSCTLTLTGNNGSIKSFPLDITINAKPVPATPTLTFTSTYTVIDEGMTIRLDWATANATSLTITPFGDILEYTSGYRIEQPLSDITYTATATNVTTYGTRTATETINITVHPAPKPMAPTIALNVADQEIDIDQSTTITWNVTTADTLTCDNIAGVLNAVSGSSIVNPTVNTTYEFTASGSGGVTQRSIDVAVLSDDIITLFTSTPKTVHVGEPVTLAWESRFGKYASIDNDVGPVTPTSSGTHIVYPTESIDYELSISGSMGLDQTTTHVDVLDALPSGSTPMAHFSVDYPIILQGAIATISWETFDTNVMACGNDIGFVGVPSGSLEVQPEVTTEYSFILANDYATIEYIVPIYVMEDYEFIYEALPDYTQEYINMNARRIYVSGGQSTSDTTYSWDIDTNASIRPNPDNEMITFAYDETGFYTITLTSIDKDGNVLKQTVRANVVNI